MATRNKKAKVETTPVTDAPVDANVAAVLDGTDTTPVDNVATVLATTSEQLTESTNVVATVEAKVNKAEIGRKIFTEEMAKGSVRKDIIARLMAEAGLTKKGAATYLQNMKDKAGLVNHKPKAVTV